MCNKGLNLLFWALFCRFSEDGCTVSTEGRAKEHHQDVSERAVRKPTAPSAPKKSYIFYFKKKKNNLILTIQIQKKKTHRGFRPLLTSSSERVPPHPPYPPTPAAHARLKGPNSGGISPCGVLSVDSPRRSGGMCSKSRDQPHTLPVSPTCFDIGILALLPRPRVPPARVGSVRGRRRPRNRPEGSSEPCKRQQLRFTSISLCPRAPPVGHSAGFFHLCLLCDD